MAKRSIEGARVPNKFSKDVQALIEEIDRFCTEFYETYRAGVTLRQIHYHLVAMKTNDSQAGFVYPSGKQYENNITFYSRAMRATRDGRLKGLIDWDHIVDKMRRYNGVYPDGDPESVLDIYSRVFTQDLWSDQHKRLEVWVEKDALEALVKTACDKHRVPSFVAKAYGSWATFHSAAERFKEYFNDGSEITILHLGDHDYTGVDATRHIERSINLMTAPNVVKVVRVALTKDQIEERQLPANFKPEIEEVEDEEDGRKGDSRKAGYIRLYGTEEVWELEALDSADFVDLIQRAISEHGGMSEEELVAIEAEEESVRKEFSLLSRNYTEAIHHCKFIEGAL